jgi:tripartite-type tricarboxylate transporter receptor subunit TctC
MNRRDAVLSTLSLAAAAAVTPASAQNSAWPSRPVRIVVPSPASSVTDLLARVLADRLAPILGQPVIVDNRPGAATNLAADYVSRQPADGYTMLLTQNTLAVNTSFFKKLSFDPVKDFEPVSMIGSTPLIAAVHTDLGVRSIKELIALGKTRNLTYATAGLGSPHHIAALLLSTATGLEMTHVAYKGSGPAALALISKDIDFAFSTVPVLLPHVQTGRLRALGIAEDRRTPMLPDVPTIGETVPGVSLNVWLGVLLPAGTPKPIIARLNTEINKIMKDPALLKARFYPAGVDVITSTPEEFGAVIRSDIARYAKITAEHKVVPE